MPEAQRSDPIETFNLSVYDTPVIALWIATIVGLVVLAWEPYKQTRKLKVVSLTSGQTVFPFYVFTPALVVGLTPFVMPFVPTYAGFNPWSYPHLLMPRAAIFLALAILFQVVLRRAFLGYAQRMREGHEAARRIFEPRD